MSTDHATVPEEYKGLYEWLIRLMDGPCIQCWGSGVGPVSRAETVIQLGVPCLKLIHAPCPTCKGTGRAQK